MWMRLRRPDSTEKREAATGKLLCSVYNSLFSAHQEGLRVGSGAQVMAGVGILRWKRKDGKVIDHPLVTLPAELQLDIDGALVIRMADAAQASLWSMPDIGDSDVDQALKRIQDGAKDYATDMHPNGILGAASPPAPASPPSASIGAAAPPSPSVRLTLSTYGVMVSSPRSVKPPWRPT